MFHAQARRPGAAILCLLVAGILLTLPACDSRSAESAPQELVGTWASDNPLYADRTLEIQANRLFFGTGGTEAPEALTIVRVRWEEAVDHTLYSIEYQSLDGGEFTLPVQFSPASGELRLANRDKVVWRLTGPSRSSRGNDT